MTLDAQTDGISNGAMSRLDDAQLHAGLATLLATIRDLLGDVAAEDPALDLRIRARRRSTRSRSPR